MFTPSLITIELPVIYYENLQAVEDFSADPVEAVQKKFFVIPLNDIIQIGEERDKENRCYLSYADSIYEISMTYEKLKKLIEKKINNLPFNQG